MKTKQELQTQLAQSERESILFRKLAFALLTDEKPDGTIAFLGGVEYSIWHTKAPHGGWVSGWNPETKSGPTVFYADDLVGDDDLLARVLMAEIRKIRGF